MKWLPPRDERYPAWEALQVLMGVTIAILTVMNYLSDVKSWRLLAFMLATWGGFALITLRKPQWMKDEEAHWRAKYEARIKQNWHKNNQGDGI